MPNPWISHVKSYAQEKGIKYRDALKDPQCKSSYKTGGGPVHANKYKAVGPAPEETAPPAMNETPYFGDVRVPHAPRDNNRNGQVMPDVLANQHEARNTRNRKHTNTGRGVGPRVLNMTRYGAPGTFTREDAIRIDQMDKEHKENRNKPTVTSVTY